MQRPATRCRAVLRRSYSLVRSERMILSPGRKGHNVSAKYGSALEVPSSIQDLGATRGELGNRGIHGLELAQVHGQGLEDVPGRPLGEERSGLLSLGLVPGCQDNCAESGVG